MSLEDKAKIIQSKLSELKVLDKKLKVFGASGHKYNLNEKLRNEQIIAFEEQHSLVLPDEYKVFLKNVGNGGAGPYYGLEPLEDSLFSDLDYKREGEFVKPSLPFPFTEPWNIEFDGSDEDRAAYEKHENEYFSEKWDTGILRICNFGCGVSLNLVVNGPEKGNIWVDDRGNDGGIYPDPYFGKTDRTTFLDWYNLWLDASLSEL